MSMESGQASAYIFPEAKQHFEPSGCEVTGDLTSGNSDVGLPLQSHHFKEEKRRRFHTPECGADARRIDMYFVSKQPLPTRQQCLPLLRGRSNTGEHTYTHRNTQRDPTYTYTEKERHHAHTQTHTHTNSSIPVIQGHTLPVCILLFWFSYRHGFLLCPES